jgi:hypothetical protein
MQEYVARYIGTQGIYHLLPVPNQPWEKISMDFVGGFPTARKGRD